MQLNLSVCLDLLHISAKREHDDKTFLLKYKGAGHFFVMSDFHCRISFPNTGVFNVTIQAPELL